ncbi:MAG TPA: hypothetical protein VGW77_22705 [Candidatus Binatia bacterium]|nr:hypothetical protein [Candidatus Binatia bacterium]
MTRLSRAHGEDQTEYQYGYYGDVVDDIGHCAGTDANDREYTDQSAK